MGKSQETFSKKEKEKKRLKKRKDKEEKAAERKANSNKGKGFEEMLAYVDAYGNITDTPPDPNKKVVINPEDIQISSPKHLAPTPEEIVRKGKVTFFNDSKGYGFIKDEITQQGVFVHVNALTTSIKENDKVTFEIEDGPKGPQAKSVIVIS